MLSRSGEDADDAGFTLIEILVALVILSVAVVTFVGVLTSLMLATEHHRGQGGTDTVARDWAEAVKKKAITTTAYSACPQWTPDLDPGFTFPSGYAANATPTVEYWIPNSIDNPTTGSFKSARTDCYDTSVSHKGFYQQRCGDRTDVECAPGVQRVTLSVKATNASSRGVVTTTQIVLRRGNR